MPVNLQAVAHELRSLAANLHCCNQDLADLPSSFLMRRVSEQAQRVRALIPVPVALVDCDLLAREDLAAVIAWLDAVETQLRDIKPPFRVCAYPLLNLIPRTSRAQEAGQNLKLVQ